MTDAAEKAKSREMNSGRVVRTTHPSYREYSWNALVGQTERGNKASAQNASDRASRQVSSAARQSAASGRGAAEAYRRQAQSRASGAQAYRSSTGTAAAGRQIHASNGAFVRGAENVRGRRAEMSGGIPADISLGRTRRENRPNGAVSAGKTGKVSAKNGKNSVQKSKKSFRETVSGVVGYFFGTQTHIITAEKKYSFPLSIIFISLSITIIIMLIITASVRINEITTENASLKATYNSLVSEEGELRLKLETRDDLRVVEDMAKNELGMVKRDHVPRYYLTVRSEDKIEIIEEKTGEEGGVFDRIASFGKSVVERILKFFGR